MIKVGEVLVSDDIKEVEFVCHLDKCKGACCVEGDLGAPLEESELAIMHEIQAQVRPYLTPDGIKAIEAQGPYILDEDGDYSTPTIEGKECAYAHYNEVGILKCGIEQAYLDEKISFHKPNQFVYLKFIGLKTNLFNNDNYGFFFFNLNSHFVKVNSLFFNLL
jgi:hypothetical protein